MFKVLSFLARRPGTDAASFRDYYENHHAPLICRLAPPPPVYKRRYLQRGDALSLDGGGAIGFDVVGEMGFPDRAAFQAWRVALSAPSVGEQVRADEERFLDHGHYFAYVVEEHVTSAVE